MSTSSRRSGETARVRGDGRGRGRWRVVDIVVCAVVGVVAGVALWAFGQAYTPLSAPLAVLAPLAGILNGGFLLPALLGGLVIRRPGAALFAEVLAGVTSMLIGTQWGATVFIWAVVQGLAAELGFALLGYRRWGLRAALLAGALAGVAVGLLDTTFSSSAAWQTDWKLLYIALSVVSGVVLAGLLGHVLVRAVARTGALSAVAAGRSGERV